MPTATRRQWHRNRHSAEQTIEMPSDVQTTPNVDMDAAIAENMEHIEQDIDEDESEEEIVEFEQFPPPGLKDISSLASWTVSSAKPGNGVRALRSPDTNQFWQSDGPQPHLLSVHFFKLVSIVHMRIFLDFQADESYTPTKIQFLAGMGVHDIQEFAEMTFEQPSGWIDVDFSRVGIVESDEDDEDGNAANQIDWRERPVLRAFLVQIRILENHQNGKDTHLRAVQLFARDDTQEDRRVEANTSNGSPVLSQRLPMRSVKKHAEPNKIKLASWMQDPDLR